MNDWQSTHRGRGALPRDLSGFEIEAFFSYSESERRVIDDERRSPTLKLALALQIGFLRMRVSRPVKLHHRLTHPTVMVDFPDPPFWFAMTIAFMNCRRKVIRAFLKARY